MNTKYPPLDCCKFIGTIPVYSHLIKTRRTNAIKMFDLLSPFYDTIIPALSRLLIRNVDSIIGKVNAQIDVKPEHRLLDVGIGAGTSWKYLRPLPESIVGIDPSMGMLRQCARRLQKLGIQGELFCQSAEQLPFANDEFDRVLRLAVLMYIGPYRQVLKEMLRVLKPTGKVFLIVDSAWLSQQEEPLFQGMDHEVQTTKLTLGPIVVMTVARSIICEGQQCSGFKVQNNASSFVLEGGSIYV